jgi:hypothetical protein
LRDFKSMIAQKLEGLHEIYADKVQSIGGLCSMMLMEKPSAEDYLAWLSEEVSGLSDVLSGVNDNFATSSIDPKAVRAAASEADTNISTAASGIQKAARAVLKKWWHSFGYDYVLSAIRAQQMKVFSYFWVSVCFPHSYPC